jgi:predicted dithiol-disulfide oxidoreductase (DUF899 family)
MTEHHTGTREEWRAASVKLLAEPFDGGMIHLNQRDVTMVCVSRAPLVPAPRPRSQGRDEENIPP